MGGQDPDEHYPRSVEPLADLANGTMSGVDSVLNRWLVIVRTHVAAVHIAVAMLLAAMGNAIVFASRIHVPSLLETLSLELVIVVVGLAVPAILTAGALRREFQAILALTADGPGSATPILLRFVGEELEDLQDLLGDLRTQGALVNQEGVSEWVRRRCFVATRGRYVSTDSCAPVLFLERYGDLMKAHADYLERTGRRDSVRICVASREAILSDIALRPELVREYIDWHSRNHVALLYLDDSYAAELAARKRLGGVIDWSLWLDEVVIAWEYLAAGLRLRLSFAGDSTYRRCHAFLHDVLDMAAPFDVVFYEE